MKGGIRINYFFFHRLLKLLTGRLKKADDEIAEIAETQKRIAALVELINKLLVKVKDFKVFGENQKILESDLAKLKDSVNEAKKESLASISGANKKYSDRQQSVPSDLAQDLSALELLTETLTSAMDEKDREFKRARTVRTDYAADVEEVQGWLQKAELKVQDRASQPQVLKENLQQIQSEIGGIADKLERLTKNGRTIIDNSHDDAEKELIQSTINNLTEQLSRVKSWLEEKKQKVGDCLDAWARFLALNEAVCEWVKEQREFLARPLHLITLHDTRNKLNEYSVCPLSVLLMTND